MFIKCLQNQNFQIKREVSLLLFKEKHCIFFTCQLGTKNGTPSFIPRLFATKTCPSSCTPRTRAVTRAPGKPSFSSSRLSNADLQWMGRKVLFNLMIWNHRKHGFKMFLTVSRIARREHYGETM